MRLSAHKARTENGISVSGENRLEKSRIIRGTVFEVCVLDDNDIAGGGRETVTQCRTFSLVARPINDLLGQRRHFLAQ